MNKGDIVTRGTPAYASRSEPHTLRAQPPNRGGQVVDPQADVIERGLVNGRARVRIQWLHQVDLAAGVATADHRDVFVNVLALAAMAALELQSKQVDPEAAQ